MNMVKVSTAGPALLNPEGSCDSVDRAVRQSRSPSGKVPARGMQASSMLQGAGTPQSVRVAIKIKGVIHFINLSEIVAIQASGNYVSLQQGATTHLLRESFWRVAEMFEPCGFIRIHRSVLINTSFVVQIRSQANGGFCLRVAGGKEYRVTRKYKKKLKSLTDYWIGTG